MKRNSISHTPLLAIALGMTVFAVVPASGQPPVNTPAPEIMFVGGTDPSGTLPGMPPTKVTDILSDEMKLRGSLNAMRGHGFDPTVDAGLTFGQLVSVVKSEKASSAGLAAFDGLGGVFQTSLLDCAQRHMDPGTGEYDNTINVQLITNGQIVTYSFNDSTASPPMNGTLEVETRVKCLVDGVQVEDHTWFWRVEVKGANGYELIPRSTADPTNPFPDPMDTTPPIDPIMELSTDMLTKISTTPLDFKLWAEGGQINIIEVKKDGLPLPPGKERAQLMRSGPHNCIDLMSENQPITGTDPSVLGAYCLGRCDFPPLVNTR